MSVSIFSIDIFGCHSNGFILKINTKFTFEILLFFIVSAE